MTSFLSPTSKRSKAIDENRLSLDPLSILTPELFVQPARISPGQQVQPTKRDVSSMYYQQQWRPRPPLSGLPLSINKVSGKFYVLTKVGASRWRWLKRVCSLWL